MWTTFSLPPASRSKKNKLSVRKKETTRWYHGINITWVYLSKGFITSFLLFNHIYIFISLCVLLYLKCSSFKLQYSLLLENRTFPITAMRTIQMQLYLFGRNIRFLYKCIYISHVMRTTIEFIWTRNLVKNCWHIFIAFEVLLKV